MCMLVRDRWLEWRQVRCLITINLIIISPYICVSVLHRQANDYSILFYSCPALASIRQPYFSRTSELLHAAGTRDPVSEDDWCRLVLDGAGGGAHSLYHMPLLIISHTPTNAKATVLTFMLLTLLTV